MTKAIYFWIWWRGEREIDKYWLHKYTKRIFLFCMKFKNSFRNLSVLNSNLILYIYISHFHEFPKKYPSIIYIYKKVGLKKWRFPIFMKYQEFCSEEYPQSMDNLWIMIYLPCSFPRDKILKKWIVVKIINLKRKLSDTEIKLASLKKKDQSVATIVAV